jgi:hypothetical protein
MPGSETSATAGRSGGSSLHIWLLVATGVLAAFYPTLLQAWHAQYLAHGITLNALFALSTAYLVPAAGFSLAVAFGRPPRPSSRTLLLRRLSLIIVAVLYGLPPARSPAPGYCSAI